jgi:hypothetical protein
LPVDDGSVARTDDRDCQDSWKLCKQVSKDAGHLRFVLGFQDHRIGLIQFSALKNLNGRRHLSDNFNTVASLEFFPQRISVKYRIHS